jgi:hypothetical protein
MNSIDDKSAAVVWQKNKLNGNFVNVSQMNHDAAANKMQIKFNTKVLKAIDSSMTVV